MELLLSDFNLIKSKWGKLRNIVFVTNIAVNIEHSIPIPNVIANPFIGPDPTPASTTAAIKVVRFASRIVTRAR